MMAGDARSKDKAERDGFHLEKVLPYRAIATISTCAIFQ